MSFAIADSHLHLGPAARDVLASHGLRTNRDLLRCPRPLEDLPGLGHEEAAMLRDWARRAESHFTRFHESDHLTEADLRLLAHDGEQDVRVELARRPIHEALSVLAGDTDEVVRTTVAENATAPAATLAALATDESVRVRLAVAGNSATGLETLLALSSDDHAAVRKAVAANAATGPETLLKLSADWDSSVLNAIAEHRSSAPETLRKLASDKEPDVRRRVGANPSAPPDVLEVLAEDSEQSVRQAVAANSSTTPNMILFLLRDGDEGVRRLAQQHPNNPRGRMGRGAVRQVGSPSASSSLLERTFSSQYADERDPWIARWWRSRAGQFGIAVYLIDCILAFSPEGSPLDNIRKGEVVTQLWFWTFFPGTIFLLYFLFKCLLGPCPSCGRRLTVSVGGTREIVERSGQQLLHGRITKSGRYDRRYNTQVRQWQQGRKEIDYTCTCGTTWVTTEQFSR